MSTLNRSNSPPPKTAKHNSEVSWAMPSLDTRPRSSSMSSTGRDRSASVSEVQVIGNKTGKVY